MCVCTNPAIAAVAGPPPSSTPTGCFPSIDRVEQDEVVGDIVELEMLLCFTGSVHVVGPDYEGTAKLGDGNNSGQVTLGLNTYRNGTDVFDVTSSSLDSVPMNATGSGSFRPGNYTVTVRDGSGTVVQTVSFELGEPRAHNLSVFRAPRDSAADLQSITALREARSVSRVDSHRRFDDPNMSQHLPLASNETLVVAVRADGLEGVMAGTDGPPLVQFQTALREAGAVFATQQTYETVTPERRPLTPDILNSSGTHLVADPSNDTYYLVVDTQDLWGEWEGSQGSPVRVGSQLGVGYAVRFSMQGALNRSNPPTDLVAADFRVIEAAVGFLRLSIADRDGRPALPPRSDVQLLARSTMAPGTGLTVRVAGLPDGPIERSVQVRTRLGGPGFELPLNLSGVENGTVLTVTVTRGNDTLDEELEAVVRRPQATIEVRPESSAPSVWIRSVTVSHPSIVAVYTKDGSLAGTMAVAAGSKGGLSVPLRTNTSGMYRVVLYQDLDRSGSLTNADEAYQQNGTTVEATVDVNGSKPTPTVTPTDIHTVTELKSETETVSKTETTTTQTPGFTIFIGLVGLLVAALRFRRSGV